MRAFVAIPLSDECRAMLDRMQQSLRVFRAAVRWVAIPSIHLTLKFLGEVNPEMIPKLSESLVNAAGTQNGFELRLRSFGCFPDLRNPRVIWCGIDGDTEKLSQLQRQAEAACASFGFAPESRAFLPHLTLGRVHGKRNLQPLLDYIKIGSDLECSFTADHFSIYQSVLRPQGAVYTVLKTIMLKVQETRRTDDAP